MGAVCSGTRSDEPARSAAYADLVSAVLDLRNPASTQDFDAAIAAAVADGRLAEPLARELRWLQRQSLRAVVEHAAQVLPATLVALEAGAPQAASPRRAAEEFAAPGDEAEPQPDPNQQAQAESAEPSPAPVDLTARRLLVAGLRPIEDPPFP